MDKLKDLFPDRFENVGVFIVILALTILFNWLSRRAFSRFMKARTTDIKIDVTNYKFLGNALSAIIYTVGLSFAIREYPPLRAFAGSLLAGAGILAAVVGFASQQAFSNIVSGIFLIIFKPFRVNDRLKIREIYSGVVEDITLRHTVIRDYQNRRIVVPNAVINSEILVNSDYDDDPVCRHFEIGLAFNANVDNAKRIMSEEIAKHPLFLDHRTTQEKENNKPLTDVRLVRISEAALVLRGYAWAKDAPTAFDLYCDLLESVRKRYDTEGVAMAPIKK